MHTCTHAHPSSCVHAPCRQNILTHMLPLLLLPLLLLLLLSFIIPPGVHQYGGV
jgi:hypothetical protein